MKASTRCCIALLLSCYSLTVCMAKKHHLDLQGDDRRYFPISTFGFYRNGYLSVDVSKFTIQPKLFDDELFGFSLEKTANPYTDNKPDECGLQQLRMNDDLVQRVLFTFNITAKKVTLRCSEDLRNLHIYEDLREVPKLSPESQPLHGLADNNLFRNIKHRRTSQPSLPAAAAAAATAPNSRKRRSATGGKPGSSDYPLDEDLSGGDDAPQATAGISGGAAGGVTAAPGDASGGVGASGGAGAGGDADGSGDAGKTVREDAFDGSEASEAEAVGQTSNGVTAAAPSTKAPIIVPEVRCDDVQLPITYKDGYYNFSFVVFVANEKEEGLYNLNFHNCRNYDPTRPRSGIDMTLTVVEVNDDDNYLSAGEMPLPALYFMMSLLFMLSAAFWFFLLRKSKEPVFKIHYLMGLLVVIKSLSLLFHAINYHFIQIQGTHMEAWAVMYYIMHLLKGALLFTVLALIGSGWAFIKHILSGKEKKIFMIVIPLQIIANVASIIIEETDEWDPEQAVWVRLLFLVDFLCCAAILLPVVWSIRHLQEASQTDGKAAMNLSKLKLFRHFYIMVVCYIYFTRIIVYLLRITVPFQYSWLHDMFREMATYVFFVLTGYKFRPATSNPYFLLAYRMEDDDDEDIVLTTTGLTETVSRVNQDTTTSGTKVTRKGGMAGGVHRNSSSDALSEVVCQDHQELNLLLPAKEDSHDLD